MTQKKSTSSKRAGEGTGVHAFQEAAVVGRSEDVDHVGQQEGVIARR